MRPFVVVGVWIAAVFILKNSLVNRFGRFVQKKNHGRVEREAEEKLNFEKELRDWKQSVDQARINRGLIPPVKASL
ncbi:Rh2b [Acrasis kona]|uniref:Rh2b n=1 Tax=Acrasis kona TaxID=1008807 RepID=A0AAW2YIQ6_9EUKA